MTQVTFDITDSVWLKKIITIAAVPVCQVYWQHKNSTEDALCLTLALKLLQINISAVAFGFGTKRKRRKVLVKNHCLIFNIARKLQNKQYSKQQKMCRRMWQGPLSESYCARREEERRQWGYSRYVGCQGWWWAPGWALFCQPWRTWGRCCSTCSRRPALWLWAASCSSSSSCWCPVWRRMRRPTYTRQHPVHK